MRQSGPKVYRKREPSFPISLRLTASERARLEAEAGTRTLSAYIRHRLFDVQAPRRQVRLPSRDVRLLAQILASLGQSEIAGNLGELSRAAQTGTLIMTPENEAALQSACDGVAAMRSDLIHGLGLFDPQ